MVQRELSAGYRLPSPRRAALLLPLVAAFLLAAAAEPAPAARNTTEGTIQVKGPVGTYRDLVAGPGETRRVRTGGLARAKRGRAFRRRSLAYFAQLTDPQISDEMSPVRVEKTDPIGGNFTAAWRPQEALGSQVLDQIARGINANSRSPVRSRGGPARLGFSILTGDQADNQQFNEVGWYIDVLRGNPVEPYSGQPISGANPCPDANAAERAALDARVAAGEYTGVQDYDDWPGRIPRRYEGFWDPDEAVARGPYARLPRYPGLMERAQRPFRPAGLDVPWYASRGNHDGLVQGNVPANLSFITELVTGCGKFFPSDEFDPATEDPNGGVDVFFNPDLYTGEELVPPDPDRRFVSEAEYKELHRGGDNQQGYGYVGGRELAASDGTASYYSFPPARRMRFLSLDTVAEGGGASGNLDDPQYQWLKRQLDRWSGVEYRGGRLRHDGGKNKLIVVYGHHTLETMNNPTPDEAAGACDDPPLPGCDADPRDSRPIHQGVEGPQSVQSLLERFPNVILTVTGHTHHNKVTLHREKGRRGFWEVNTASHMDFPQQSRLIEITNNRDNTLSIFGTMVDDAAPVETPPPGPAAGLSDRELASLSRRLAANDPQSKSVTEGGGRGRGRDRNIELLIKNPRRLAR